MGKTIRLSDDVHDWVESHRANGETMEETLRRLTRGPDPDEVAGLLTSDEAEQAKAAVARLRTRDVERR